MNLNKVLFPAPECSYNTKKLEGELIWIPQKLAKKDIFNYSISNNSKLAKEDKHKIDDNNNSNQARYQEDNLMTKKKKGFTNFFSRIMNKKSPKRKHEDYDIQSSTKAVTVEENKASKNSKCSLSDNESLSPFQKTTLKKDAAKSSILNPKSAFTSTIGYSSMANNNNNNNSNNDTNNQPTWTNNTAINKLDTYSLSYSGFNSTTLNNNNNASNNNNNNRLSGKYDNQISLEERLSRVDPKKKKKMGGSCFSFLQINHKKKMSPLINCNNGGLTNAANYATINLPDPFDSNQKISNYDIKVENVVMSSESDEDIANSRINQGNLEGIMNYRFIPCLLLQATLPSSKVLLYFHGNGEDIYLAYDLLEHIRNHLQVHVIAVEYPGYGLYEGSPSEKKILADAEKVFDYLTITLKISPSDIIIFGRSIGTGPATWLASQKNPALLILMSPFTSIRKLAKHVAGSFAQFLIKERFKNLDAMKDVKCPVFILHGQKDTLIPWKHSQQLYDACTAKKYLHLSKNMTHEEFEFYEDLTLPLKNFLKGLDSYNRASRDSPKIIFPKSLFEKITLT